MPGASIAPAACVKRKHASRRRRFAENVPAFPARMVLTVSFVLSPVNRACCHRHRRNAQHCRQLDASVGASGPHDFAVRLLLHSSRAPKASTASRAQRFVTIAKRPSYRGGTREEVPVICPTSQATTPATRWHDGQIRLAFPHGEERILRVSNHEARMETLILRDAAYAAPQDEGE